MLYAASHRRSTRLIRQTSSLRQGQTATPNSPAIQAVGRSQTVATGPHSPPLEERSRSVSAPIARSTAEPSPARPKQRRRTSFINALRGRISLPFFRNKKAEEPTEPTKETTECKRLHKTIEDLSSNCSEMTGDALFQRIEEVQASYRAADLALCSALDFDSANNDKRRRMLKQIEYYYEKRSIKGCFLCDERIINSPLREFALIDAHHVSEEDKEFNPSECVQRSLEAGRLERRKCCPLCKGCHIGVHNDDNIAEQLEEEMAERGFKVDRRGGGVY